jgi:hypothetical protein
LNPDIRDESVMNPDLKEGMLTPSLNPRGEHSQLFRIREGLIEGQQPNEINLPL